MAKKDPRLKELANLVAENIDGEDLSQYTDIFLSFLGKGLGSLQDNRQQIKVKHALSDCVGIVLFSVFSGIDEWIEMEYFANDYIAVLRKYLPLENGIPSHDTLERVIAIIKPDEMQNVLVGVLRDTVMRATQTLGAFYENKELDICVNDIIALDGKEIRNTGNQDKPNVEDQRNYNALNVQSTETGVTLSSTRIDEKTNEIPEAQAVLKTLDLHGCIVTADALNTQKETVSAIVNDARADYCLAVKGNQKKLYEDLLLYFRDADLLEEIKKHPERHLVETEEKSGETITWEHFITDDIGWYGERHLWKKLKSFAYVKKTIQNKKTGNTTVEERFYICSFKPLADLFALTIRRHWHIENLLHWVLDVVFKEDTLRTKEKKALHNLGLIKRFVLSILKILKPYYNMSYNHMRRKIGRKFEEEIPVIFLALKKMYDM